ncbi:18241_t:CDS:2, partial [Racocetra persica]
AVYVEKPIVDPLTDFIPLIPTNNRVHAEQVARLFKALYLGQYNQRAHELCSEIGKVPKLFYINKEVVDGFYMVVMDYIEAMPLYYCDSLSHDEYKTILEYVEEAIDKLHDENIVYADLRDSNILPPGAEDRKKLDRKYDIYWLKSLKTKYL